MGKQKLYFSKTQSGRLLSLGTSQKGVEFTRFWYDKTLNKKSDHNSRQIKQQSSTN
jgi:hypothetical protein